MRLEPRCRADMSVGLQARIYDPLWLLARQWQVGEFQGEDNGSPAVARWQGEAARLNRYFPGPLPDGDRAAGEPFDSSTIPLETLVEREPARPGPGGLDKLRFAADAGAHFLRVLSQQPTSRPYRDLFIDRFRFTPHTEAERGRLDEASRGFVDLVMPRLPDGRKLYAALTAARPGLPPDLAVVPGDAAEVQAAAEAWLRWYETLIAEPAGPAPAWSAERLEYGFSVAARTAAGEKVLTAREYSSGRLDWQAFDLHAGASLGAAGDAPGTTLTWRMIPAPVTYRGMPAARFWAFEDARVDFGAVDAGPEDLARMLLVEFAVSYGNDWFVIPVDLPVGSLCRTTSLVVTNTFGEHFVIRPASQAGEQYAAWRMFQLSSVPQPGRAATVTEPDLFLLPPAVVASLESRPVEEVLFLRDEMANLAWAVERVVESATERPLNRFEQERYPAQEPVAQSADTPRYRLATAVPDNWVPLLPVRGPTGLRLRRAKVLEVEGEPTVVGSRGHILNPDGPGPAGLAIHEEEVPREGVRVVRTFQLARWQDGSTHLWIGRQKSVGRGEGSSGLRFDTLSAPRTGT
jgi:hypothetical protein